MSSPVEDLRAAVAAAIASLRGEGAATPAFALERPKRAEHGDYATNAAMLLAPALGKPPREIAEALGGALADQLGDHLAGVEVAGPGFLNLRLGDGWYREALGGVVRAGDEFGRGTPAIAERVLVEFVSANPTGPVHVGHARNAAYGDAISRLLEFAGHTVEREFYVNDYGSQIARFGESIQARARGEEPPEGGYVGDYVVELAKEIEDAATRPVAEVAQEGVELMRGRIDATLRAFGVVMDTWFSERSLHEGSPSPVDQAFARLEELGETYRADGALWLRTTAHGDDKDRVLERSSGEHTYFASDVAYHQHKRARGFDRQIDVWGADHHGYVERTKAAYAALGGDPDELDLLIMQFVQLVAKGKLASMSKRAGKFVTLDELVAEIGVDVARWFLLARSHDTTLDLDLDLAVEQSNDNPVYYVQYAHARIAGILTKAGEDAVAAALDPGTWGASALEPAERELVRKLLAFEVDVADAAERRAPHRVATYALELAQTFTAFYRDCQVVGAEGEGVEAFRIALSVVSKRTLARALDLLGVSAPESM
jgi:arginyl-tRNA synthetase